MTKAKMSSKQERVVGTRALEATFAVFRGRVMNGKEEAPDRCPCCAEDALVTFSHAVASSSANRCAHRQRSNHVHIGGHIGNPVAHGAEEAEEECEVSVQPVWSSDGEWSGSEDGEESEWEDCVGYECDYFYEDDADDAEDEDDVDAPFWFGHEEEEHLKLIFETYSQLLLDHIPRGMFVGKVHRVCVAMEEMQTLDRVVISQRAAVGINESIPVGKTLLLLSTWSDDDGLPKSVFEIPSEGPITQFWRERSAAVRARSGQGVVSPIIAQPAYGFQGGFEYVHGDEAASPDVEYSPKSLPPTPFHPSLYARFLADRSLDWNVNCGEDF